MLVACVMYFDETFMEWLIVDLSYFQANFVIIGI
jgi:hypothetical protein